LGSTFEVVAGAFLAKDRAYITEVEHSALYEDGQRLAKSMNAFMRIPDQTGHAFHGKLDSHSRANWTVIPVQTGQA
jgi:hypothetical protein